MLTSNKIAKACHSSSHNRQTLFVENPLLWSTDDPNLYQIITQLDLLKSDKDTSTQYRKNITEYRIPKNYT